MDYLCYRTLSIEILSFVVSSGIVISSICNLKVKVLFSGREI